MITVDKRFKAKYQRRETTLYKSQRATRPVRLPRVDSKNRGNQNGVCKGCGANVPFWYSYELCNGCVVIRPGAVVKGGVIYG